MATTAYTIYSHYDPAVDRERLERETGQTPRDGEDVDPGEAWEAEAKLAFKRHLAPPPRFVPAVGDSITAVPEQPTHLPSTDVAGWYRSLTTQPHRRSPPPVGSSSVPTASERPSERLSKNNWFIMNAITSEPAPAAAASPTLADILARDPPPLPHESQYKPPVWLALGPANKGFAMLQHSGWSEGEALGPDISRRPADPSSRDMIASSMRPLVKEEVPDSPRGATPEVIDLTLSDSDSGESDVECAGDASASLYHAEGSRKALITPIATVLKSDRLGIGLKAKTVGPYKASQRRITHNAAAMQAHVKAAEELRKQKRQTGRGHRGFAKQRKVDEAKRRELLAYMNEG
ncbi:hypothetical protein C8R43DRAFT_1011546 [Mycena crocata]|nr:hypothetical protein C8R43DRAFT_1011546 [Mycena crocata]